ncbi:hypothetical protein ANTQUA_LOCUS655 [Anthophora quadrimaculata]
MLNKVKSDRFHRDESREPCGQSGEYNRRATTCHESAQTRFFPCKRCFECNETGHLGRVCPKKKKEVSNAPRQEAKSDHINTCTFCLKRGHTGYQCWTKQRTLREDQIRKREKTDPKKLEANFRVKELGLTPLLFQDLMVHGLLDSGADCSIVREKIAKQANCKIEPHFTTIHGLGGGTCLGNRPHRSNHTG